MLTAVLIHSAVSLGLSIGVVEGRRGGEQGGGGGDGDRVFWYFCHCSVS